MDVTAFILTITIVSVAVGVGVLVWRLTPRSPRIEPPRPTAGSEAGDRGDGPGWTAPATPARPRGGAQPVPVDPATRPTPLAPVPSERPGEFVAQSQPAAGHGVRTRLLGFLGMITLVAASAAALAGGIYWAARTAFQAIERYFAE